MSASPSLCWRRGDFELGWEEYEWRRKSGSTLRTFAQPQWDGGPLDSRTLLIHSEQGFGDAIQFIRYLPLVSRRGGRIIIECPVGLQRLLHMFAGNAGNAQIVLKGQPLPAYDVYCPLLSLPRIFRTTLSTLPAEVPYLHADPEDVQRWNQRLAGHSTALKVGLVWAGSAVHTNDRNRSMTLADLAPLSQVRGVRFFSLQLGKPAAQAGARRRAWKWLI